MPSTEIGECDNCGNELVKLNEMEDSQLCNACAIYYRYFISCVLLFLVLQTDQQASAL